MINVSVIYHMFPHYRAPVLRELAKSQRYNYAFWGSHRPVQGIECFSGDHEVTVRELKTRATRRGFSVSGIISAIRFDKSEAIILLGNPNIYQTWTAAAFARLRGAKVLFWAHGWLRREPWPKAVLRNFYFSLAHGVLVYGDRAKALAAASGFDDERVHPIYNSLDWAASSQLYEKIVAAESLSAGANTPETQPPRLICTARLTPLCRFDLLLDAMNVLRTEGMETTLKLIGDGPERAALEAQSKRLGLDVEFLGAVYDERRLAELIYSADATVSPGKVGLTAMHSLTYGTPVVTHSDLDEQMPEVEAIVEGETGAFFKRGDVTDLARAIRSVVKSHHPRPIIRARCRSIIADRYTPERQRELIEAILDRLLRNTQ